MDPIASIKPYKDTTLALMLAAQQRGYALFYFEMHDLWLRDGVAYGRAHRVTVFDDKNRWFEFGDTQVIELGKLNAILLRKYPPFEREYVTNTYLTQSDESA